MNVNGPNDHAEVGR